MQRMTPYNGFENWTATPQRVPLPSMYTTSGGMFDTAGSAGLGASRPELNQQFYSDNRQAVNPRQQSAPAQEFRYGYWYGQNPEPAASVASSQPVETAEYAPGESPDNDEFVDDDRPVGTLAPEGPNDENTVGQGDAYVDVGTGDEFMSEESKKAVQDYANWLARMLGGGPY